MAGRMGPLIGVHPTVGSPGRHASAEADFDPKETIARQKSCTPSDRQPLPSLGCSITSSLRRSNCIGPSTVPYQVRHTAQLASDRKASISPKNFGQAGSSASSAWFSLSSGTNPAFGIKGETSALIERNKPVVDAVKDNRGYAHLRQQVDDVDSVNRLYQFCSGSSVDRDALKFDE